MNRPTVSLGLAALLVAACTTTILPPPSLPRLSPSPAGLFDASAGPSRTAALPSCSRDQLALTAGHTGGAAGTNYLTIFVELAQGPACVLADSPKVTITAADGV